MSRPDRARDIREELTNPEALCRELGLVGRNLQRQRGGVLIPCPFHAERTPSCSVTLGADRTIRVRCFACGAAGDALTLIAHVRGLDLRREFRAVIDAAAEIAKRPDLQSTPDAAEPPELAIDDAGYAAIMTDLAALCPLDAQRDVMAYVARRGLLPAAKDAGLFALPYPHAQGYIVARLIELHGADAVARAGVLSREKHTGILLKDRFVWPRHRLGIPWRAPDGTVQSLQRRCLDGEPKYVFARGRRSRFPFAIERLASAGSSTPIAFCEGALDTIAFRLLAVRGGEEVLALGLPGVDGWRPGWARLARGRAAYVALDNDDAAERKRPEMVEALFDAGAAKVERLRPKDGAKDWCELLERGRE